MGRRRGRNDGRSCATNLMKGTKTELETREAEMEKLEKTDAEWQSGADARAVRGAAQEGHRARVHRRLLGREGRRHVPLRRLRPGAVQLRHQVRLRHRVAQLLGPGRRRQGRDAARQQPVDAAHRGRLCALRRPPGARLRRRPEPDRAALLHQLLRAGAGPRTTRAPRAEAPSSASPPGTAGSAPPIAAGAPASSSASGSLDRAVGPLAVLDQGDQGARERRRRCRSGCARGAAGRRARGDSGSRGGEPGSRWCSSTR